VILRFLRICLFIIIIMCKHGVFTCDPFFWQKKNLPNLDLFKNIKVRNFGKRTKFFYRWIVIGVFFFEIKKKSNILRNIYIKKKF
jgi:hypothetical protein